jgi:hypothetical protein
MGFAQVLARMSAQLAETYPARLGVLLRKFLLVEFEPAELQSIVDAGTAQEWLPVTLFATPTVYPRDASGFARADGALEAPAKHSSEPQPDNPDDPEYGPYSASPFARAGPKAYGEKGAAADK